MTNTTMRDKKYQVQRRARLNLAQYQRLLTALDQQWRRIDTYYILTHRFGSLAKNNGDLRIRWMGPEPNTWDTYEMLSNKREHGDIFANMRVRDPRVIDAHYAQYIACAIEDLGIHPDPWWAKRVTKHHAKHIGTELISSIQHMWGGAASFGYILEVYHITIEPDKKEQHLHTIDGFLERYGLVMTPEDQFKATTLDVLARNLSTIERGKYPAIVTPEPALDDSVMQDWVRRGLLDKEYLEHR
ncbi:hypothetical protein HY641_00215 [Candidatus Woesearchaeota archaeon]|nr:hypothetical protein [Candidatus Woesearchaeota archaeon]